MESRHSYEKDVESKGTYEKVEEQAALLGMKEDARSSSSSLTLSGDNEKVALLDRRRRLFMLSIAVNIILALISVGSLVAMFRSREQECLHGPDVIYSPAREAVYYEPRLMNNSLGEENPFKGGHPTHEQTLAWRELLRPQLLNLTEADMKAIGRLKDNSVQFSDGSGYMGQLDMYHELHCLNYIREYIHRDYYDSIESPGMQVIHVDHCIDTLRQILICHADTSIVTYDWEDHHQRPYPNFAIERECRNWDSMFNFIQANVPDMRSGLLVHPIFGPVDIEGKEREASPHRLLF